MFSLDLENPAGKRLVLIPGNDLCAAFYRPLGESLKACGFSVRLLTLPGFHGTSSLPSPGIAPLVERIEALLAPDTTLVGHSLGGLLALLVAVRSPHVERLVLMEPAIVPFPLLVRAAVKKYRRDVVQSERDRFDPWSGSYWRVADVENYPRWAIDLYREVRRTTDPQVTLQLLDDIPAHYPLPFERLTVPTLLLSGAETGSTTRFAMGFVAKKLRAEHRTIEGAAHWLANEKDADIAAAIARFVGL